MSGLLIDVGNSRLKWAYAEPDQLGPVTALGHDGTPAATLSAIDGPAPTTVWVANVTGAVHRAALAEAIQARYGLVAHFAATQAECGGLRVAYTDAARLGVDRWLALLAAWNQHGAACVASCGTALTFDAVDQNGQHLGGVIAPGLLTAQQAVLGATRFPSRGPDDDYVAGLGTDTEACVRQGALHACAGLVERLAARHTGTPLLLTGGDAERLRPHLGGDVSVVPDLVLQGLLALARSQGSI